MRPFDASRARAVADKQAKQAFDRMPGLPARDDEEVEKLMEVVSRLPRENVEEIARCLMRAAVGFKRTGNSGHLTTLAVDSLVTIRLRRLAEVDRALKEAPARPAGPEGSVDVEAMLRDRGL
jgi:hypothetical protein